MNTRKLIVLLPMLLSAVLSACAPATTPSPAASIPTTAVPPTQAPTVAVAPTATTFTSKSFKVPMSVTFGADWNVTDDASDLLVVQYKKADFFVGFNLVTGTTLADPANGQAIPFPEDFLSWIQSDPDFSAIESTQVTVGGISGLQIDATAIATRKKHVLILKTSGWDLVSVSEHPERWRFIDLGTVQGERLLILSIAPADQFESLVQEAQVILAGVVFLP